ncbi:Nn.00g113430.m01.CDS01 [Neocucurbitaria sp. VM-36]
MATNLFEFAYALAYITFVIGTVSVIARFYSRAVLVKSWGWDDTAAIFVLIVSIVHQVVLQLFLNLECGKPGNVKCTFLSLDLLRTAFIEEIVIYTAHCIIKAAFLLFYYRLSPERSFRIWVYLGFGLDFAVFLSSLLMTVLQCIPFEKILNPALHPEVKCIDTRTVMLTPPVLNIAMDLYILILPISTIWSLQMTFRRKITILSVLAFGLVSVIVAIIRLPVLVSVTSMKTDASVDVGKVIIIAAFEVQCAIVAVNLPALKALWTKLRGAGSSSGSKDPASQRKYKLSSMDTGLPGRSKKNHSIGVVTSLERGLSYNESEEELTNGHGRIETSGDTKSDPFADDRSKDSIVGQSITVTTDVNVQVAPESAANRLPPIHGLSY